MSIYDRIYNLRLNNIPSLFFKCYCTRTLFFKLIESPSDFGGIYATFLDSLKIVIKSNFLTSHAFLLIYNIGLSMEIIFASSIGLLFLSMRKYSFSKYPLCL